MTAIAEPSEIRVEDAVGHLAGNAVMVVGDVMLDHFFYGSVDRISPEAPIPVLRRTRHDTMLGGAGNVARNISSLGGICVLVGATGQDANAQRLQQCLEADAGIRPHLVALAGWPTTVKTRFVAEGQRQQLLRVDDEAPLLPDEAFRGSLMERVREVLDGVGAVILSDYGKGLLHAEINAAVAAAARERGLPVIVDPKGKDYSCYRGATIVTPNRKEIEEATDMRAGTDDEVIWAARKLIADHGFQFVLVTRSSQGMSLVSGRDAMHLPTHAQEVFDVSGAGDTVVGALALALASGVDLHHAVRIANCAAGVVVAKAGTAVAYPHEVKAALSPVGRSNAQKVMSPSQAALRVKEWREAGLEVGFANGCFDLLHAGHVRILEFARSQCDRLVVGLNSDASVRRLKGPSRPVQSQDVRSIVLSSLADVDLVVVFDEETPLSLIEKLEPEVLIKGADYTEDAVVGGDFVLKRGGRIRLCPLVEGQSTTSTIRKMGLKPGPD